MCFMGVLFCFYFVMRNCLIWHGLCRRIALISSSFFFVLVFTSAVAWFTPGDNIFKLNALETRGAFPDTEKVVASWEKFSSRCMS